MHTRARSTPIVIAIAASVAALLSACSLLGPSRDADGRVTATTEVGSTRLLVGDCFSFVDDTSLAKASLTPCTDSHSHVVIGVGELANAEIDVAGGLQNAVSAACTDVFSAYTATAAEGTRPEQEFVVSTAQRDGETITSYLCVATDAQAAAAG